MNHHHYHRQNGDFIDQEDHPITTTHPRRSSYGPNLTGNTVYQDVRERTRFNNRTEGMYFSCNGNESFRAVHPPEGIVADKYVATRPRNDYFDDVNPGLATYTRMGDVVDTVCHAAKRSSGIHDDTDLSGATYTRMGDVVDTVRHAAKHPTSYVEDVNPNNETYRMMGDVVDTVCHAAIPSYGIRDHCSDLSRATYTRMGDVVDTVCHAAKPMTRHVVDVNPTYATHPRMGVVKNFGSVAKPVYGIQDESNVSDSNHTHARVATTRHSSIIPQTRLLGGVHFKKSRRGCMDSFTNQS